MRHVVEVARRPRTRSAETGNVRARARTPLLTELPSAADHPIRTRTEDADDPDDQFTVTSDSRAHVPLVQLADSGRRLPADP